MRAVRARGEHSAAHGARVSSERDRPREEALAPAGIAFPVERVAALERDLIGAARDFVLAQRARRVERRFQAAEDGDEGRVGRVGWLRLRERAIAVPRPVALRCRVAGRPRCTTR